LPQNGLRFAIKRKTFCHKTQATLLKSSALCPLIAEKLLTLQTESIISNKINKTDMNENEQKQQGLQIELTPEVAQGEYANFAIITHSSSDFVFDFARVLPGVPKAQVKSRVIMAPEHAKRLMLALQENIGRYERAFGPIKLPNQPQEGRTIAPFNTNKGEA
jgi:hypothetical protein